MHWLDCHHVVGNLMHVGYLAEGGFCGSNFGRASAMSACLLTCLPPRPNASVYKEAVVSSEAWVSFAVSG